MVKREARPHIVLRVKSDGTAELINPNQPKKRIERNETLPEQPFKGKG